MAAAGGECYHGALPDLSVARLEVANMPRTMSLAPWVLCGGVFLCSPSQADIVCPDSSYCVVVFNRVFSSGSQFPAGSPYNWVTISPEGFAPFFNVNGVTEADGLPDIDIRVYLRNCNGTPIAGMPAAEIVIYSPDVCFCAGGNEADAASDAEGCARFTQQLRGGGCARVLEVWAGGVFIGELRDANGVAIWTNSGDFAHMGTTPCQVDASDLALFATQLGRSALVPWPRGPCFNFNLYGGNVSADELVFMSQWMGEKCR